MSIYWWASIPCFAVLAGLFGWKTYERNYRMAAFFVACAVYIVARGIYR